MEEVIIEFVKGNPCLYEKACRSYRNKNLREKKWQELALQLNTNMDLVKKRWKTLRDKYHREKKSSFQKSGSASHIFIKWKYHDQMAFLDDNNEKRKMEGNYSNDNCIEDASYCDEVLEIQYLDTESENITEESLMFDNASNISVPSVSNSDKIYKENSTGRKKPVRREAVLLEQSYKDMADIMHMAKSSFAEISSTQAFFNSLSAQVEEAKLPFDEFSSLQIKLMKVIKEDICKYNLSKRK